VELQGFVCIGMSSIVHVDFREKVQGPLLEKSLVRRLAGVYSGSSGRGSSAIRVFVEICIWKLELTVEMGGAEWQ
jgi:hypothetical protein